MIVITGATGNIGSKVVRQLSDAGVVVRALSRDPSRGEDLPHVTRAEGDLADPETLGSVFEGAECLFLLTGNSKDMARLQKNAVDAAAASSVSRVVKLSARGAQAGSRSAIGRWHHEVEEYIKDAGLAWTMLRPHVFMQNLLGQAERISAQGEVRAASGDGLIPFIDTRDIADVAANVLTEEGHVGETYVLTGGEALSYGQVAAIIGGATGRDVAYVAETEEEARKRLRDEGEPDWLIDSQIALASYQRTGGPTARITRQVFEVTSRAPRSMVQFAYDHLDAFGSA